VEPATLRVTLLASSLASAVVTAVLVVPARAATDGALQPPTVVLEVVPARDAVEHGERLSVVVVVTNKSAIPLRDVRITVPSVPLALNPAPPPAPTFVGPPESVVLLGDVPAFGSAHEAILLTATDPASFGSHKLPVVARYAWSASRTPLHSSAQTATLTVQVKRRFEEEGRALPGGAAAFLYLLLPVVPAFMVYDLVDRWRRGEELSFPRFDAEQLVPAFLMSLLLSIVFAAILNFNVELAYRDPRLFLLVIAVSAALGAALPTARWAYAKCVDRRWAFADGDSAEAYLRKALLGPRTPSEFDWLEGTDGNQIWNGVKLVQPDGSLALGARLQVSTDDSDRDGKNWTKLTTLVFDGATRGAALKDRNALVDMVERGTAAITHLEKITRGTSPLDAFVVVDGLRQWTVKSTKRAPLVEPVR